MSDTAPEATNTAPPVDDADLTPFGSVPSPAPIDVPDSPAPAPAAVSDAPAAPVDAPAPADAPSDTLPPNMAALIDQLSKALLASPQLTESLRVAQRDQAPEAVRTRAVPAVGELVAFTHISNRSGLPHTQRGLVASIDDDNRVAYVVWLPDGEAAMPVDMLDD